MTKPRVLISDKMDPNAEAIFRDRGCDVDVITGETPEQLIAASAIMMALPSAVRPR
jgi:D-3-phosphoglycerate dehydrogenase